MQDERTLGRRMRDAIFGNLLLKLVALIAALVFYAYFHGPGAMPLNTPLEPCAPAPSIPIGH